MEYADVFRLLTSTDETRIEDLFCEADRVRRAKVGDAVHLRGLVEFSNHCARSCGYCGIRAENQSVCRYRMTLEEIVGCAHEIARLGYGTMVLQGGEDWGATTGWIEEVIRAVRAEAGLAITLSLGERNDEELVVWRAAGADRYLLRFETSNQALYDHIHPPLGDRRSDRFAQLRRLRELGYEVGSGILIGIPGQTYADLARDILCFQELDLDMIGVGPYIPHPGTPLYAEAAQHAGMAGQVPADVATACRVVALARLVCPDANIPSTTALASLAGTAGRLQGLRCGANILMPNVTPDRYRRLYEIYPDKAVLSEVAGKIDLGEWLRSIGRTKGTGQGGSLNWQKRVAQS